MCVPLANAKVMLTASAGVHYKNEPSFGHGDAGLYELAQLAGARLPVQAVSLEQSEGAIGRSLLVD